MDTNLTMVAATAIGKMLIMVIIGYAAVKLRIFGETETNAITKTVLNVTCPMLILASYMQPFDPAKAKGLLLALALGVLIHIVGIAIGYAVIRREGNPNWQVERMAVTYGNVGFMGIPLMSAMFGSDAVFYLSTICLVYNFLIWTHGLLLMTGKLDKASLKKVFISPNIACMAAGLIIFLCRIPVPEIIASPISSIGNCTTPLAMLASGAIIARSSLGEALKEKRLYLISALRLFAVPAVVFAFVRLLHVPYMVALTAFTAAACPMGAMVTMFAAEHKRNAPYASGIFTFTTVLSLITIPALIAVYGMI